MTKASAGGIVDSNVSEGLAETLNKYPTLEIAMNFKLSLIFWFLVVSIITCALIIAALFGLADLLDYAFGIGDFMEYEIPWYTITTE